MSFRLRSTCFIIHMRRMITGIGKNICAIFIVCEFKDMHIKVGVCFMGGSAVRSGRAVFI
jgi:hypothetical protein